MFRRVVRYMNDPVLERPADLVTDFGSAGLRQLVEDMFETMYDSHGVEIGRAHV